MLHRLVTVLMFLLTAFYSHAQDEDFKKVSKKSNNPYRWSAGMALGITPLPDNQLSLLPGIEFFINEKFSLYNEIAIHLNKNYQADSGVMNKKYFRYKGELRYYFAPSSVWSHPFLGLQFSAATRKFDNEKGGYYYERKQNDSSWVFDRATVNSPFITTSLQLGLCKKLTEDLFLESSIGYGVKFVNTEYTETNNLRKERNFGLLYIKPIASYRYIGRSVQSHFTFFMRVSYRF